MRWNPPSHTDMLCGTLKKYLETWDFLDSEKVSINLISNSCTVNENIASDKGYDMVTLLNFALHNECCWIYRVVNKTFKELRVL